MKSQRNPLELHRIFGRISNNRSVIERIFAWEGISQSLLADQREQLLSTLEMELITEPISLAYERIEAKTGISLPFLKEYADPVIVSKSISEESCIKDSVCLSKSEFCLHYHLLEKYLTHIEKHLGEPKEELRQKLLRSIIHGYQKNEQSQGTTTLERIDSWRKRVKEINEEDIAEVKTWNVNYIGS